MIEDAHYLDEASSDLLAALTDGDVDRPWGAFVTRRGNGSPAVGSAATRIEPLSLSSQDAIALAEAACDVDPLPRT